MAEVLFISEDYIKSNTIIDENVDVKLLLPTVLDVQNIELHPCIGSGLYNDLITKIDAGTTNADEDTLIKSYIAPMLLKYVMVDSTVNLLARYRNKNVSNKSSDNSQPVDYTEMKFLMDNWRDKAEFYKQRLIEYLCAKSELFPAYCDTDDSNDLLPESNAFTSSFYLGTESWEEKKLRLRLKGSL